MLEIDLYQPVKDYLQDHGYTVQAEVRHCDIVAQRDQQVVVVELKTSINLTLLIQATDRQTITSAVYVAVPETANRRSRQWRGTIRVLRKLQLGLLVVNFGPLGISVKKAFDPSGGSAITMPTNRLEAMEEIAPRKSKQHTAIIREIAGRSGSYNTGGVHQQKLITAYRENAVLIGCCLQHNGPSSTRELRKQGTGEKTSSILSANYYQWFERVSRGVYCLTPQGVSELKSYPELCLRAQILIERSSNLP
jgi:hypothetical protein|tara:strand:- start:2751 stop:3500 length:750 start_codon:yes stop_codon:yes gene_type:complete